MATRCDRSRSRPDGRRRGQRECPTGMAKRCWSLRSHRAATVAMHRRARRVVARHACRRQCPSTCPPEPIDAEDLLYLLYTSVAPPARPKGIMHTTGGYLLRRSAWTHEWASSTMHPDTDVYWCAADVGWVTGHTRTSCTDRSMNGTTTLMLYEGAARPARRKDRHLARSVDRSTSVHHPSTPRRPLSARS